MATATNVPVNTRRLQDINYIANITAPIAANVANTNALNLIQATPYPVTEKVICQVSMTASSATANSKNINVWLQHTGQLTNGSIDTTNYANIPQFAIPLLRVTDNGAGTTPAGNTQVLLPPNVKQYVRAQAQGEANGGNAADATVTLTLLF